MSKLNKPIVGVNPTFLLRGVEPLKVLNDYLDGKFQNVVPPEINNFSVNSTTLNTTHGDTPESESYFYRDKTNGQQLILTTNHKSYAIVKENDGADLPIIGPCFWCRVDLKNTPVGIPVTMTFNREKGVYVFGVDQPYYCTCECCFSGYKRDMPSSHRFRDPLYEDSEQMLKLMHHIMHPNAGPLKAAPDWRLHQYNGGPLSEQEFRSGSHTYARTTNLVLLPVKVEYSVSKS